MRVLLLLVVFVSMVGAVSIQEILPHRPVAEGVTFKFNEGFPSLSSDAITALSFGYSRVMSGFLWLRFLQNSPPKKMEKDEISWIYLDLEAITNIDPDFLPAFEGAAMFLSVITDDKLGAQKILEKGIRLHPDRWRIRNYLGYHYEFELHDPERAKEQYIIGSKLPDAPLYLSYYAANLIAKQDSFMDSIQFLENMKKSLTDEELKEATQRKIDLWKQRMNKAKAGVKRHE